MGELKNEKLAGIDGVYSEIVKEWGDMYVVNDELSDAAISFYGDSKKCVRGNDKLTEWFVIETGLREG